MVMQTPLIEKEELRKITTNVVLYFSYQRSAIPSMAKLINNNKELVLKRSSQFKCAQCDSEFVDESNLVKHMDTKHEALEVQQYALSSTVPTNIVKCDLCKKLFKFRVDLKYHTIKKHQLEAQGYKYQQYV